jgi:hypothetical protein
VLDLLQGRKENGPDRNYVTKDRAPNRVLRSALGALRAVAERPQHRERVQPGGVAALECDLKRVLSDEADVLDTELFGSKVLDTREAPWGTCLTATFGAGAGPAELLARIGAVVSVLPIHGHHLAFAVHVDVDWKRVGVLQLVSRPLPDVDHRQLPE